MTQNPSELFQMPHERNPHFTGRGHFLAELREELCRPDTGWHVQAIYGLSGVGKSQLAIEYAYRYREQYRLVCWLAAEDTAALWVEYARLARTLGVVTTRNLPLDSACHLLRKHLEDRDDFLLIFDNATQAAAIAEFIPSPCRGHVLITSRNPSWSGLARSTALHGLARSESIQFLRQRTGRLEPDSVASKLAQALGDLPLALEQAAAVITRSRISFAEYLAQFENYWAELLTAPSTGGDWPDSVAMTWELSLRQAEAEAPDVGPLLSLLAFLAVEGIERRLLERHFVVLPDEISMLIADGQRLDRALEVLASFSLVEVAGSRVEQTISLHRLVGALARGRLSEDKRRYWAGSAARLVLEAFAFDSADTGSWGEAERMLPHALAVAMHAQASGVPVEITCGLLDRGGRFLNRLGRYEAARGLLDRALALSRRAYGDESPRVSAAANNLGRVLARLGRHEEAGQHLQWALSIDQGTYGDADPHVASVMNNYAMVLHAKGELEPARQYFEYALAIFEQHYGSAHAKVAILLNNLGYIGLSSGDVAGSAACFRRALEIAESTLGAAHPTGASMLHNLGTALTRLGQNEEARQCFERALAISQGAYGENHPEVGRDLEALSSFLKHTGDDRAAARYAERAAQVRERAAALSGGKPVERSGMLEE